MTAPGLDDGVLGVLREQYEAADDADRPRCALMLGLALADRVAALPDETPGLADAVDTSLSLLIDGHAAAAVLGCQAQADGQVLALRARRDVLEALPAPPAPLVAPGPGRPAPPRAGQAQATGTGALDAEARQRDALRRQQLSGPAGQPDQAGMRALLEQAHLFAKMMPRGPGGDPMLDQAAALSRMLPGGMESLLGGQWSPQLDQIAGLLGAMADMPGLPSSGPLAGGGTAELAALVALLPAMKLLMRAQSPNPAGRPSIAELDEAIARLEPLAARLEGGDRALLVSSSGAMCGATLGILLVVRVKTDLDRKGLDGWPRAWHVASAERLRRARRLLEKAPPEMAEQARVAAARIGPLISQLESAARTAPAGSHQQQAPGPRQAPGGAAADGRPAPAGTPHRPAPAAPEVPDRSDGQAPPAIGPDDIQLTSQVMANWDKIEPYLRQLDVPGLDGVWDLFRWASELQQSGNTARWTEHQQSVLDEIEAAVAADAGAPAPAPGETDLASLRTLYLALARGMRCSLLANSPNLKERPEVAEIERAAADVEAALAAIPAGLDGAGPGPGIADPLRFLLADLLVALMDRAEDTAAGPEADRRRLALLTRARQHLQSVSAGVLPNRDRVVAAALADEVRLRARIARSENPPAPDAAPPAHAAPGSDVPGAASAEETEARRQTVRRFVEQGVRDAARVFGEQVLGGGPAFAARPLGATAGTDTELLRSASEALHRALEAVTAADPELALRAHALIGLCQAELYWRGEADPAVTPRGGDSALVATLRDATSHLTQVANATDAAPSAARAEHLDVLARCWREAARLGLADGAAERAEQAALAALATYDRCVLLAGGADAGLAAAAPARRVVSRLAAWALRDRRPEVAVLAAEAGRSLLLTSMALTGGVEEVLRGAGETAAADAWRRGDPAGLAEGLRALEGTSLGRSLLFSPQVPTVQRALYAAGADAVVYLLPPSTDDPAPAGTGEAAHHHPARALVLRQKTIGDAVIEVVPLGRVETGPGSPLSAYTGALAAMIAGYGAGSGPGAAFADALDAVGRWAHEQIVGPLVRHTAGWELDHTPHLVLVPLGELAAVPYPAAWTDDASLPAGRRYTPHDLVLSHAVSARLLAQVSQRRRLPLTRSVTFAVDPGGEFPFSRRLARDLRDRFYPDAALVGKGSASLGEATPEAILAALPGETDHGASLLFLVTHGVVTPELGLRAYRGDLALRRILDQARTRRPDADGGLVVTSACITDTVLAGTDGTTQYDEAVTLATALLAAGATAVIGTRWPIVDNTSSRFQFHLHSHLAAGNRPAEALRLAQLDMLAPARAYRGLHRILAGLDPALVSHPSAWAGYVHHGL